jgi:hypothetical protein
MGQGSKPPEKERDLGEQGEGPRRKAEGKDDEMSMQREVQAEEE